MTDNTHVLVHSDYFIFLRAETESWRVILERMDKPNFYELLEIERSATLPEIKDAYKKAVLKVCTFTSLLNRCTVAPRQK
jgi:hypothetical protein